MRIQLAPYADVLQERLRRGRERIHTAVPSVWLLGRRRGIYERALQPASLEGTRQRRAHQPATDNGHIEHHGRILRACATEPAPARLEAAYRLDNYRT